MPGHPGDEAELGELLVLGQPVTALGDRGKPALWAQREAAEVNAMRGFTEHSQVPNMFASAGLPHPELLDLLVSDALARSDGAPVTRL